MSDLPAGPEIDALVRARVLGWPPDHSFCPSTEMEKAWWIVEKMNDLGWLVSITSFPDRSATCEITCDRLARETWYHSATAGIDETPLAICRAALKAVGA